jgi:outer membrane protein assembly factor BamB
MFAMPRSTPVLFLVLLSAAAARADDWPQWLGPQRDGVWRETGIIERFTEEGPKVRWRTPIGAGYSGPAVAGGRVYITDRVLGKGVKEPGNPFVENPKDPFGKRKAAGQERVLCLDEKSGKVLWTHAYDCPYEVSYPLGPRTTPVVDGDKVYTLGTMGDLLCLKTKTGTVLWEKNFPKGYEAPVPVWGFASAPLIDGKRLISLVGGQGSAVVAFDKETGKELWRALTASDIGYCPPVIFRIAGQRQLIIWHADAVNALDPETGKVFWSHPVRVNAAVSIATPRLTDDKRLFVSSFYNGTTMLKLDGDNGKPSLHWKGKSNNAGPDRTDGLHCMMSTPFYRDGYIYGVCSWGQLRCIKGDTGERVWESIKPQGGKREPWGNSFLVMQDGRFFIFSEKGDLIIARLTPKGYEEVSRAHLLEPCGRLAAGRPVIWSHPAFANQAMFARNDLEIISVSLAAPKDQ